MSPVIVLPRASQEKDARRHRRRPQIQSGIDQVRRSILSGESPAEIVQLAAVKVESAVDLQGPGPLGEILRGKRRCRARPTMNEPSLSIMPPRPVVDRSIIMADRPIIEDVGVDDALPAGARINVDDPSRRIDQRPVEDRQVGRITAIGGFQAQRACVVKNRPPTVIVVWPPVPSPWSQTRLARPDVRQRTWRPIRSKRMSPDSWRRGQSSRRWRAGKSPH